MTLSKPYSSRSSAKRAAVAAVRAHYGDSFEPAEAIDFHIWPYSGPRTLEEEIDESIGASKGKWCFETKLNKR